VVVHDGAPTGGPEFVRDTLRRDRVTWQTGANVAVIIQTALVALSAGFMIYQLRDLVDGAAAKRLWNVHPRAAYQRPRVRRGWTPSRVVLAKAAEPRSGRQQTEASPAQRSPRRSTSVDTDTSVSAWASGGSASGTAPARAASNSSSRRHPLRRADRPGQRRRAERGLPTDHRGHTTRDHDR
jgi:hypothetical protein